MKVLCFSFMIFFILFTTNIFSATSQGEEMKIFSSVFSNDGMIPEKYTCDGKNISPPLSWSGAPENTKSFVLIVDDPDAPNGTWDHWIVLNIPAHINAIPENVVPLTQGMLAGKNSWGQTNYGGPCPPSGVHRYFFKLYALNVQLSFREGATKEEVLHAMKNHVLKEAELVGKYARTKTK